MISGSRVNYETLYPKNTADWLPMASLIYGLTDQMKVRGVISRTMARAEYRELVPFAHQDMGLGYATRGNPDLRPTYITNYDLRWEYYPRPGEILAVSVFSKSFTDPIEIVVIPGASRPILQYENIGSSSNYGVEFEARKSLGFLSAHLSQFSLGSNVTLTKSKMILNGRDYSRPLSGQSPFIINSLLGYTSHSGATSATLLYNAFGDRLVRLTTIDQKGLYEKTRHQVDFTLSHKLWQTMTFKFAVKNLLNEDYLVTQEQPQFGIEGVTEFHKIGRTVSMGVSYGL